MLVIVAQDVADACDLGPRNLGMPLLHVYGQVTAGLGNDLDAAFHDPLIAPIGLKDFQWNAAQKSAYPLTCFDYVG